MLKTLWSLAIMMMLSMAAPFSVAVDMPGVAVDGVCEVDTDTIAVTETVAMVERLPAAPGTAYALMIYSTSANYDGLSAVQNLMPSGGAAAVSASFGARAYPA